MYKYTASLYLKGKRFSLLFGILMATLSRPVFAWQALGNGLGGNAFPVVYALKIDSNGNLIAGGNFNTAFNTTGSITTGVVAKWDGITWSSVGGELSGTVLAMTKEANGNLIVGGSISADGGLSYRRAFRWNGSAWNPVGDITNNLIYSLTTDSTDNLIAGYHFPSGLGMSNSVIQWNGNAWSALGSQMNGGIYALLKDSAGNLLAGGDFTSYGAVNVNAVIRWDGTTWSSVGNDLGGPVYALTLDNTGQIFAGGAFNNSISNPVVRWSGSHWWPVGTLADGRTQALAVDAKSNLYAGGVFHIESTGPGTEIVRWNGNQWQALGRLIESSGSGAVGSMPTALATDTSSNLYVGGSFNGADSNVFSGYGGVPVGRIAVYVYQDIPANQWRLFSLPHAPLSWTTLQDTELFGDDFSPTNYNSAWVVYERNEATKTYRKLALTDPLVQGKGYWVYSTVDATLDMDGTATPLVTTNPNCTSSKGCYEVALTSTVNGETKRNNLVGFPFFRPTSWANVRFEVNGFAYSPSAAETNNFAAKTLWKYNGSSYETYDDVTPGLTGTLSKMEGFWVRLLPGSTGKNVKLLIPLS